MNPFEIESNPLAETDESRQQARELKLAQYFAQQRNPDQTARAIRLAQDTGTTVPAAEAAAAPPYSWDELRKTAPILAKYLTDDLQRAAAVGKDAQALAGFERWFAGFSDAPAEAKAEYDRTLRMIESGNIGWRMKMGTASPEDRLRLSQLEAEDKANPAKRLGYIPGILPMSVQALTQQASAFSNHADEINQAAFIGGLSGAAVAGAAGSVVPGAGTAAGAGLGFAKGWFTGAGLAYAVGSAKDNATLEGGNAYIEYLKIPGVSEAEASASAGVVFLLNGGLEFVELGPVMGLIPGLKRLAAAGSRNVFRRILQSQTGRAAAARLAARVATVGLMEGFQEFAQEFVTIFEGLRAEGLGGWEASKRAFGPEGRERMWDSFVGGTQMAAGLGALNIGVRTASDLAEVRDSKRRAAMFQSLSDISAASEALRERLPKAMQDYVEKVQAQHHGAPETVSAPAEKIRELQQAEGLSDAWMEKNLPDVARQLREVGDDGAAEIVIPTAAFATHLAGRKNFRVLQQDLRVGNGLTLREALEAEKRAGEIESEVSAESGRAPAEKSPVVRVYEAVRALSGELGHAPDQARKHGILWASVMESRATRTGTDPWTYFQSVGLQVEHTELTNAQLDAFNAEQLRRARAAPPAPAAATATIGAKAQDTQATDVLAAGVDPSSMQAPSKVMETPPREAPAPAHAAEAAAATLPARFDTARVLTSEQMQSVRDGNPLPPGEAFVSAEAAAAEAEASGGVAVVVSTVPADVQGSADGKLVVGEQPAKRVLARAKKAPKEKRAPRSGVKKDKAQAPAATTEAGPVVGQDAVQGADGLLVTPQHPEGERVVYAVVELAQLVPSHDPKTFVPSPNYPDQVQERDYQNQPEEKDKVVRGARDLNPLFLLSDDPTPTSGPPMVTAAGSAGEYLVMGGNARSMMLKRAQAEHQEKFRAYVEALKAKAAAFGIPSEKLDGMSEPVLVRVFPDLRPSSEKADLAAAVRRTNEDMKQKMSADVLAVAEARALTDDAMQSIGVALADAGESSLRDVMRDNPKAIIEALQAANVITPQNRSEWLAGGEFTDAAKDRLEGMFLGRVVGTGDRLRATAPSMRAKLERIVPALIRVDGVNAEASEIPTVQAALDIINDTRARGLTLEDRLAQTDMFGGGDTAPAVAAMARLLAGTGQKALAAKFKTWAGLAGTDPRQGTLLGGSAADARQELLGAAAGAKVLLQDIRTLFQKKEQRVRPRLEFERLDDLPEKERGIVEREIDATDHAAKLRSDLERLAGTPWMIAATDSLLARAAIKELLAGRLPDFANPLDATNQSGMTGLRDALLGGGHEAIFAFLHGKIIGHPEKPGNAINGSFADCEPSKACATWCYAADGRGALEYQVVKSEVITMAVQLDPRRAAKLTVDEYRPMAEFRAGKALRLFDKGDGNPSWAEYVRAVEAQGVRLQIFSKKVNFLSDVSDFHLRLLSVDSENMAQMAENPELPFAFVYSGTDEEAAFIREHQNHIGVILPIRQGEAFLTDEELNKLPEQLRPYVCPVDKGAVSIAPALDVIDKLGRIVHRYAADNPIQVKRAEAQARNIDGSIRRPNRQDWRCTNCDVKGGVGCFFGRTTQQVAEQAGMVSADELQSATEAINDLRRTNPQLAERLSSELAALLRAAREGALSGSEGRTAEGGRAASPGSREVGGAAREDGGGGQRKSSRLVVLQDNGAGAQVLDPLEQFWRDTEAASPSSDDGSGRGRTLLQADRSKLPPALVVDLKKAGSQEGILASVVRQEQRIREVAQAGVNVVIPLTRSFTQSPGQFWAEVKAKLGEGRWVAGVTPEDAVEMVSSVQPERVYFIGLKPGGKEWQALAARVRAVAPGIEIVTSRYDETRQGSLFAGEKQAAAPAEQGKPSRQMALFQGSGALEGDDPALFQGQGNGGSDSYRGSVSFDETTRNWFKITLTGKANLSTFLHESGHVFLELLRRDAAAGHAPSAADVATLETWAGVAPGAAWSDAALEKFARGFESYLREGKAPSSQVAEAFAAFKAWLSWIYKSLFSLDVELTDDVRSVMDRLVASDDAITQAQQDQALLPIFQNAEAEGFSKEESANIAKLYERAVEVGRTELMTEAVRELRRHASDEAQRIREGVTAELDARPDYNAWNWFTKGVRIIGEGLEGLPAGVKLDLAMVQAMKLGAQAERKLKAVMQVNGIDPEIAAPYLGFESGAEMVRALADLPARGKLTESMVNTRMAEKYPGYDGSKSWFAEQANQKLDSKPMATAIAAEIGALNRKIGGENPRTLQAAITLAAKRRVARMTAQEIEPFRFRKAAAIAGKEKQRAWADGNLAAAAQAARRQLWNLELARLTQQAKEEIERIRWYLDTFSHLATRKRIGKASQEALAAIDALLEGVEFKRRSDKTLRRRASLGEYIATMREAGALLNIPLELQEETKLVNYRSMTLEQLQGVEAVVANIDTQAGLKNKLLLKRERLDLEKTASDVATRVSDAVGAGFADKPGDKQNPGFWEKKKEWLRNGRADLTKIEFLVRVLDGGVTAGPLHQLIFQPLRDAEGARQVLTEKVMERLLKPLRELSMQDRVRFDSRVDFLGWNLKFSEVVAIALNVGNESNLEKLAGGYAARGWSREKILLRLDELMEKRDWDLVQHIWDTVDSLWPEIKAMTERNIGVAPPRVEARETHTRHGVYRGGYYPVVYDRRKLRAIQRDIEGKVKGGQTTEQLAQKKDVWDTNNFMLPYVSKGFTEARVKYEAPILLSLDLIPSHINEVIHYLTHYEAVKNVDKLLQHPLVEKAITEGVGREMYLLFRPWLQDIARDGSGHLVQDYVDSALRHLRIGSSIVMLGMKWTTGLMQALGLLPAMKELGTKWVAVGTKHFMDGLTSGNPFKAAEDASPEQRRLLRHFDREIGDLFDSFTSGWGLGRQAQKKVGEFSLALIIQIQRTVNTITWYAAHAKALEEHHANPVGYADSIVAMTQSSAGMKDMAEIQRGAETKKLFVVMYTYYSVLFNQLAEGMGKKSLPQKTAIFAVRWWWLILLPTVLESLMRNKKPEPGDEESISKMLIREQLLYAGRTIPLLGTIGDSFASDLNVRNAPWLDTMYRAAKATGHGVDPSKSMTKADKRAIGEFVGMLTQTPTGGFMNGYRYLEAYTSGQLKDPVRDLLFRSPKTWE